MPDDGHADELLGHRLDLADELRGLLLDLVHDVLRDVLPGRALRLGGDRERVHERLRVHLRDGREDLLGERADAPDGGLDARDDLRDDLHPHRQADVRVPLADGTLHLLVLAVLEHQREQPQDVLDLLAPRERDRADERLDGLRDPRDHGLLLGAAALVVRVDLRRDERKVVEPLVPVVPQRGRRPDRLEHERDRVLIRHVLVLHERELVAAQVQRDPPVELPVPREPHLVPEALEQLDDAGVLTLRPEALDVRERHLGELAPQQALVRHPAVGALGALGALGPFAAFLAPPLRSPHAVIVVPSPHLRPSAARAFLLAYDERQQGPLGDVYPPCAPAQLGELDKEVDVLLRGEHERADAQELLPRVDVLLHAVQPRVPEPLELLLLVCLVELEHPVDVPDVAEAQQPAVVGDPLLVLQRLLELLNLLEPDERRVPPLLGLARDRGEVLAPDGPQRLDALGGLLEVVVVDREHRVRERVVHRVRVQVRGELLHVVPAVEVPHGGDAVRRDVLQKLLDLRLVVACHSR